MSTGDSTVTAESAPRVLPWPATPTAQRVVLATAAEALRRGELVVLPTDTVYGIAAHPATPGRHPAVSIRACSTSPARHRACFARARYRRPRWRPSSTRSASPELGSRTTDRRLATVEGHRQCSTSTAAAAVDGGQLPGM